MADQADEFIRLTNVWLPKIRERCKEDEEVELTCSTNRGWMRVHHIALHRNHLAIMTGVDQNGNFVERLSYEHALDLTATIIPKVDKKASIGFSIERTE